MACAWCAKKRKAKAAAKAKTSSTTTKVKELNASIPTKPTATVTATPVVTNETTMVLEDNTVTSFNSELKLSEEAKREKLNKINEQKRKNYIRDRKSHVIYKARFWETK